MAARVTDAAVATAYTLGFVLENLPEKASDILEIGCGEGELATRLVEQGFNVVALDVSEECVAAAKARGVDARVAEWPAGIDGTFDAVLFTRSLHHVHDLSGGVTAARQALRAGGRLIVEDFRAEGGSERSSVWFTGLTKTLFATGAFRDGFDLRHSLAKIEVDHHEHELHSSTAIADALGVFGEVVPADCAYYFRYLEPELLGGTAAQALLDHELELIAADCIDPLGKRFIAWN